MPDRARRSLDACTTFCFATFGGSCVETAEKAARRVELPEGEERLALVDVPTFEIHAVRGAWDAQHHRRFIQSTRL
jgi:hypothetical protein